MTNVSIHAPVRERPNSFAFSKSKSVSIHAPVRERQIKHHFDQLKTGFNSRSREGATWIGGKSASDEAFQFTLP